MTKEKINECIKSIIGDAGRLEIGIRAMDDIDPERFPEEYEKCYKDAVRQAEWLTCRLRHLLYETASIRKPEYLLKVAETLGIKLCDRDGIFQITLPGIIFGDNRSRPTEFLYDPLYFALEKYIRCHRCNRYRRCVVCFVQIFDRESRGCVRLDMSNPELKRYLDVVAAYLLIDDSSKYMDLYQAVELGDRHAVEMFIMEPDRFHQWLRERGQSCEKTAAAES